MVPCSLIRLVHMGLIVINAMALASGIVTSSRLTRKRVDGNIIVRDTLILGCYEAIVIILLSRLSARPIRCIGLSIRSFIGWSIS